jgi:hypothetical protein
MSRNLTSSYARGAMPLDIEIIRMESPMGDRLWAMLAPVSWGTRSATAACVALPNVIGDRAPEGWT